jgi:16S rRNA (cytidine1402-2'-O)-methyltransferase
VGKIILLNTPIGNLGDITSRVLEALKQGTQFAVEDTRAFKDLLNHLGISLQGKYIQSLHDQSGSEQIKRLLELAQRDDLYVASEAGSPIVSDPAYPLIVAAYEAGLRIESYSGVSSPIMALELAGLPPLPFHFHGFLPRENSKRAKAFEKAGQGTHIYFEAPTRIEESVDLLAQQFPAMSMAVVRELSKKFEQVVRFKGSEWPEVKKEIMFKGEFILLFHKESEAPQVGTELREIAQEILAKGAGPKTLSKLLGQLLERPTKDIYSELTKLKKE